MEGQEATGSVHTRELVERSRAGDRSAFEELIGPLAEPAYRLACGMLLDRDEAEDAVQEATLRAWLKLAGFREGADPRPWFLTIGTNPYGTIEPWQAWRRQLTTRPVLPRRRPA